MRHAAHARKAGVDARGVWSASALLIGVLEVPDAEQRVHCTMRSCHGSCIARRVPKTGNAPSVAPRPRTCARARDDFQQRGSPLLTTLRSSTGRFLPRRLAGHDEADHVFQRWRNAAVSARSRPIQHVHARCSVAAGTVRARADDLRFRRAAHRRDTPGGPRYRAAVDRASEALVRWRHRPSPGNWQALVEVEAVLAALLTQWPALGLEQPRALRWSDDAIARSGGFAGILATRIPAWPASRSALHSVHAPLHTRLKNRDHREIGDAC